ncbi:four-helix bundle copper-binding protein [Paenibacillus sp. JCM 10914]|uniref:four-helix bundle copper-binding protein n=1 Tax=Paenibacillus sp. JCM 10914 TaxID=1236974 RepID=UPI0003CCBBAA|nr:four-helix bundle copper-binding protein [Paenibacillus sp. JCM 10914]GAE04880.1 ferredoxin [Paenibacillus sp. JCM 10914]
MLNELKYKQTIEAALECMNACNVCYVSCLKEYELAMLRDCITLDRECADICSLAAQAMSRKSPYTKEIVELCIKVCLDCAEECGKHEHDHCKQCAEACRKCAEACRELLEIA